MRKRYFALSTKVALAVSVSVLGMELIGVNRLVRQIVQVNFWELEALLSITLWLLVSAFVLYRADKTLGFWRLVSFGFVAGSISGLVGAVGVSIVNYQQRGIFNSALSWTGVLAFVAISILGTCGWLIGTLSGAVLHLLIQARRAIPGTTRIA